MTYVGTLPWARQTGGRIRVRDRAELIRLAGLTAVLDMPPYLSYRWRNRHATPPATNLTLDPPVTVAACDALERLNAAAPDFVVNHSVRTYWFSRWIGEAAGMEFDNELLYLACLAHDVGLCTSSSPVHPMPSGEDCFSIRGARWATDIATSARWDPKRTDRLAEAITLNLNGRVPPRLGVEAHLMMRGVLLDVTGLNASGLDPARTQGLFQQVQRLGQRKRLPAVFQAEATCHPACRAHFALRGLGFGILMRHPPHGWT